MLAAKTYPTERPVAVIEEFRPHNVFHVAGEDETVLVAAVARYFGNAGIINGFHERVAVIEEVRAPADKLFYGKEMALQRGIHLTAEFGRILMQHPGTLLEGQSHGAVAAVVRRMAGCLVGKQVYMYLFLYGIFQKVHHIAVIGDGNRSVTVHGLFGQRKGLRQRIRYVSHPALTVAGFDTRGIHFGYDSRRTGHLGSFGLGAAHTAQTGRDEKPSAQVTVLRDTELQPSGIQKGVESAVHNALRPDIHPPAGSHLTVIGYTHLHGCMPVLLIIIQPYHHCIRNNDARRFGFRLEESQRMPAFDNERLVIGKDFKVLFYQAILHPILAHLPRLTVSDKFVRVKGYVETKIIVYHHLKGLTLDAASFVFVDGLCLEVALRTVAVAVNASARTKFFHKFRSECFVQFFRDVA